MVTPSPGDRMCVWLRMLPEMGLLRVTITEGKAIIKWSSHLFSGQILIEVFNCFQFDWWIVV